jgi:hypothetical protein
MRHINSIFRFLPIALVVLLAVSGCSPQTESEFTPRFTVIDGEYKLPASIDPLVTSALETELWGHVWRPAAGGAYPLVLFLHGNHNTCGRFDPDLGIRIDDRLDYTTTGVCPDGYQVTPNHRGYDYLAESLASYGYVVVSINANRGVNQAPGEPGDMGLNLRRGRLVLRHLEMLARWNSGGEVPHSLGFQLTGLINFAQVGLMGHSRGGEGMRAAIAQYHDPDSPWPGRIGPVSFRSLFEIAPVDGQTGRTLNAENVFWNVLLPACDGDVSDLQGIKPFDRMLLKTGETASYRKSTFQVFGANHNFYNTEWQESDAENCSGQTKLFPANVGSPKQRETAIHTLIPFFRSNTGSLRHPDLALRFDPSYPLPSSLTSITTYARGYSPAPRDFENFVIDSFDRPTGTSSRGVQNLSSGLTQYEHGQASLNQDSSQRAAAVQWSNAGGFLQVNAAWSGSGVDARGFKSLEFRVMLRCFGTLCGDPSDPTGDLDFSILLASVGAPLSKPVALKSRAVVHRPCGTEFTWQSFNRAINNELFQTIRIPLSAFPGFRPANFQGVRFFFDHTAASSIYLADVRLTRTLAAPTIIAATDATQSQADSTDAVQVKEQISEKPEVNEIKAIRTGEAGAALRSAGWGKTVEIEVASTRPFTATNALPELHIGNRIIALSRYPSGTIDRLIFTLDEFQFRQLQDGVAVTVRIGGKRPWNFGSLDKGMAGK